MNEPNLFANKQKCAEKHTQPKPNRYMKNSVKCMLLLCYLRTILIRTIDQNEMEESETKQQQQQHFQMRLSDWLEVFHLISRIYFAVSNFVFCFFLYIFRRKIQHLLKLFCSKTNWTNEFENPSREKKNRMLSKKKNVETLPFGPLRPERLRPCNADGWTGSFERPLCHCQMWQ